MRRRRVRGQALIWLVAALPLFLSSAGLAIDGGLLLASRRHLQSLADGAARAGATRLDLDRLRATSGADVRLDGRAADDAVRRYLSEGLTQADLPRMNPRAQIAISERRVRVQLDGTLPTAFLRVVHIESVPISATAQAEIQSGIRQTGDG
jgi:uncharacterized membrane protein